MAGGEQPRPRVMKQYGKNEGRIHNFSTGVLDTYFHAHRLRTSGAAWEEAGVLALGGSVGKAFAFDDAQERGIQRAYTAGFPIYSTKKLDLPGGSKFVEHAYDLTRVFDPASYPNSKKRHQRIRYPFAWAEKNGLSVESANLSDEGMLEIMRLHDQWVAHKMADPDTFRQMFPQRRYIQCVMGAASPEGRWNPCVFAARLRGTLGAIRVLDLDGDQAYDLAFFGNTWDTASQLMEYFNTLCLRVLLDLGVRYVNCGAQLDKSLKQFKGHFPSYEVVSWAYPRSKSSEIGLFT